MLGETLNEQKCVAKLAAHSVNQMPRPQARSEPKTAALNDTILQEFLVKPTARLSSQAAAELCHGLAMACCLNNGALTCKQVLRKLDMQLTLAAVKFDRGQLDGVSGFLFDQIDQLSTPQHRAALSPSKQCLPQPQPDDDAVENTCLAMQGIATLCSKVSDQQLLHRSSQSIVAALESAVKASSSCPRSRERVLQSGLRALNIILTSAHNRHGLNMIDVVEVLRQCLTHGVELDAITSVSNPTTLALGSTTLQSMPTATGQGPSRYRPPHARRQSSSSSGWSETSDGSRSGSERGSSSDSDSSRGSKNNSSSHSRASALRLATLSCLQTLIKADSRALHPHWPVLLPVYSPLQTKYHPATLMDAIVRDPIPKVRASAAAALSNMLEGPAQKAYLRVAEAKSAARPPIRGFTTLSTTLGHLVIALHDGLLHAISNEAITAPLVNMMKALQTLMASAEYSRLPADMLPRCIECDWHDLHFTALLPDINVLKDGLSRHQIVSRRLQNVGQKVSGATATDTQLIQTAACACLAAAFGTKEAVESVASVLAQGSSAGAASSSSCQAHVMLLDLSISGSIALRTEALAALTGLARNYPLCLLQFWSVISHAVATSLTKQQSNVGSSGNTLSTNELSAAASGAKYAQQGMKLLTSYLAACNGIALNSTAQHCHDSPAALQLVKTANAAAEASTSLDHRMQSSIATDSSDSTASRLFAQQTLPAADKLGRTSSSSLNSRHIHAKDNAAAMVPDTQLDVRAGASPAAVHYPHERSCTVLQEAQSHAAVVPDIGHHLKGIAQCTEMWAEVCGHHIPTAQQHSSPPVRAAAQACLSECAYPFWEQQPEHLQKHIWHLAWSACELDDAAAVKAGAAKCLGNLTQVPSIQSHIAELTRSTEVLHQAAQDQTLSVRVAVLAAVANLTDVLKQQQAQLQTNLLPILAQLSSVAVLVLNDNDKVVVNAVRALGNLFAIHVQDPSQDTAPPAVPCSISSSGSQQHSSNGHTAAIDVHRQASASSEQLHQEVPASAKLQPATGLWWAKLCPDQAWCQPALACLLSSLNSHTEKVQWNACYAIGSLFLTPAAASLVARLGMMQQLLQTMLQLIQTSPSYKVQNHAAAALANLTQRSLYGELWPHALKTVSSALAELQDNAWQDQHDSSPASAKLGSNHQFKDSLRAQLHAYQNVLLAAAQTEDAELVHAAVQQQSFGVAIPQPKPLSSTKQQSL